MRSTISLLLRNALAKASGQPIDYGRRNFLKKSAMATVALSLPFTSCQQGNRPRIVIVGAGIAGMTASYHLSKQGIEHTIYEAAGRIGGRVLTVQDAVIKGAHVDFGAEFIDSIHDDLLNLAKELNVELVDLEKDALISKAYFFEGKMLSEQYIVEALKPFAEQLTKDISRLPEELHFSKADLFADIDQHSVNSYLKNIGMDGWLLRFFEMAMEGEYAMDPSEQSAINLLTMLSVPMEYEDHYHLLGNYHEVYKFKGGSQKFTESLGKKVEQHIKLGHRLQKLSRTGGTYSLQFETASAKEEVIADYVLLALPFTVLRDIERDFQFGERKEKWIAEAGFGNAVKVAMGFNERVWRAAGFQGYTFTDINRTVFWDSSQMVDTDEGSLTFAGGGAIADELSTASYGEIKDKWLAGANTIYPGVADKYNGKISKFPWMVYPYSKGSYTCYKKGQWSAFAGIEAEPFENIFFAGEHCSVKHQGFMNGAVETGRKAAENMARRLKE